MANIKKNYKKGYRLELIKLALACGGVPFTSMKLLFGENVVTAQHRLTTLCKEGIMEKYHDKEVWIFGLTPKGRAIVKANLEENEDDRYLINYNETYATPDLFSLKTHSKELKPRAARIMRNNESLVFFYSCGINAIPGEKLGISEHVINPTSSELNEITNSYYLSREFKLTDALGPELEQTTFQGRKVISGCRLNGLLVIDSGTYSVINISSYLYRFSFRAETKALTFCQNLANSTNLPDFGGTILLYKTPSVIHSFVAPPSPESAYKVDNLLKASHYKHVFAIPNDENGQKMTKLMMIPNWKEVLKAISLPKEYTKMGNSLVDCDGRDDDDYFFLFLIPDIGRLSNFIKAAEQRAIESPGDRFYIYIYKHQAAIFEDFKEKHRNIKFRSVDIDSIISEVNKIIPEGRI